jgi:hypothetical protein
MSDELRVVSDEMILPPKSILVDSNQLWSIIAGHTFD